mmetsp:Transcript_28682/g.69059  ORF Transcript_28682/g.69059 Transcript_28682/m.69059 type:complete len:314 (+) Transcript_28682:959-1900(+)
MASVREAFLELAPLLRDRAEASTGLLLGSLHVGVQRSLWSQRKSYFSRQTTDLGFEFGVLCARAKEFIFGGLELLGLGRDRPIDLLLDHFYVHVVVRVALVIVPVCEGCPVRNMLPQLDYLTLDFPFLLALGLEIILQPRRLRLLPRLSPMRLLQFSPSYHFFLVDRIIQWMTDFGPAVLLFLSPHIPPQLLHPRLHFYPHQFHPVVFDLRLRLRRNQFQFALHPVFVILERPLVDRSVPFNDTSHGMPRFVLGPRYYRQCVGVGPGTLERHVDAAERQIPFVYFAIPRTYCRREGIVFAHRFSVVAATFFPL